MGIQDLFNVIKERCPEQIMSYPLAKWRGQSFAIDISIFLNKYVKTAGDIWWMNIFFMFICTLKKHGIKMVCIFDGPNPPPEKQAEQQSRRDQSKKAVDRMNEAIRLRKLIHETYLLTNTPFSEDIQQQCKSVIITKRTKLTKVIMWHSPSDVYDNLTELIDRLFVQTAPITDKQREQAWDIVHMMGLPSFQADGEAEALCAYLQIHGYVDAVLTEDSDVLAYGTEWMVAFRDYKMSDEKIYAIHLPSILEALEYTMDEFRDLCILLSCDYNFRVKGYPPTDSEKERKKPVSIGMKHALSFIDEYRRLEDIEPYIEDITPLVYPRCRELFTPSLNEETFRLIQEKPYNSQPDLDRIHKFLKEHRLTVNVEYIESCWKPTKIVFIDSDDENGYSDSNEDNDLIEEIPKKICEKSANRFLH